MYRKLAIVFFAEEAVKLLSVNGHINSSFIINTNYTQHSLDPALLTAMN
jgi:hypothetical protein